MGAGERFWLPFNRLIHYEYTLEAILNSPLWAWLEVSQGVHMNKGRTFNLNCTESNGI